jgi:GNAT superfamily N-acetyltransferase
MVDGLRMSVTATPDPQARAALVAGLVGFHEHLLGAAGACPLAVLLHDANGALRGGLWGRSGHGWLFIELLFVPEVLRGQGLGGELLAAAEVEAVARGCCGVWLDTMNPQALPFYLRHGYESFGELPDYPAGNRRVFLRRRLG